MTGTTETFLPQPTSDYDGWELDQETYLKCPDACGERSPETANLGALLKWIDGHVKTCSPTWITGGRTP